MKGFTIISLAFIKINLWNVILGYIILVNPRLLRLLNKDRAIKELVV